MTVNHAMPAAHASEQEALWYLGGQRIIAASAEHIATSSRLTELVTPAGTSATALKGMDEAIYVLAGNATVVCGKQRFPLYAGAFLFLPSHVPYYMQVSADGPLNHLTWMIPSGFAQDVTKLGQPNEGLLLAPPATPDVAKIHRLAHLLHEGFSR